MTDYDPNMPPLDPNIQPAENTANPYSVESADNVHTADATPDPAAEEPTPTPEDPSVYNSVPPHEYQPPSYTSGNTGNFFPPQCTPPPPQQYQGASQYQEYYSPYYQSPPPGYQQKSRIAASLLGIMFGSVGVHNFYLGFTSRAVTQLALFVVGTIFTFGVLSVAIGIWGFVEGVQIMIGKNERMYDANNVILRD